MSAFLCKVYIHNFLKNNFTVLVVDVSSIHFTFDCSQSKV